jgi:hypothetical protein
MSFLLIFKLSIIMIWRLWYLCKYRQYDVLIWGFFLAFLIFVSIIAELVVDGHWGIQIMILGSLVLFFAAKSFHDDKKGDSISDIDAEIKNASNDINNDAGTSSADEEFISVKSYTDSSQLTELESDKMLLSQSKIFSKAKTLGITNLLVRASDFERACEILGVESRPYNS